MRSDRPTAAAAALRWNAVSALAPYRTGFAEPRIARSRTAAVPNRARFLLTPGLPMHIRDWPETERPREKLLNRGPNTLSDAELLAIFLGSGVRGSDAVASARKLLTQHGPLRKFLERGPSEWMQLPGIGQARACAIAAALELGTRHLASALERGDALTDPFAAGRYFAQKLRGLPHEVFAALFLDTRHRAIAFEELFRGTIDGAAVHPREVLRQALAHNAAALILAHNHPSGVAEPSHADEALTRALRQALALVDVKVLDHFVVAGNVAVSFAERGLL